MTSPSQINKETSLLRALRQELVGKIQEDWESRWKPLGHGESFSGLANLPSQTRFVNQLFEDIYDTLTRRFSSRAAANDFMIDHERTLARFLSDSYAKGFSVKTRNTIASYVGYQNYADFVRQYRETHEPPPSVTVLSLLPIPVRRELLHLPRLAAPHRVRQPTSRRRKALWISSLVLIASLLGGWSYWQYRQTRRLTAVETALVSFREVSRNAPTNPCWVTFDYDFSALGLDSLTLQHGGTVGIEEGHQTLRSAKGRYSLAFYKGGMHLLTLRHRDQIVKRIPVLIPTGGWNCYVAGPGWVHPDFIPAHYIQAGCLFVNPDKSIIDSQIRSYFMTHHYLARQFAVSLDSLTLECRLQNKPDAFGISCYDTKLTLADDQSHELTIEFMRPGCSERTTKSGDPLRPAARSDRRTLDASFPLILDRFYVLKIVLKNGVMTIYLDGQRFSANAYPSGFGNLREARYKFKGSGKVDFLRLTNSYTGRLIYFDDFGGPAVE